jgi:hypothetical protein
MPARTRIVFPRCCGEAACFASPRSGYVGRYPTQGALRGELPHTQDQMWGPGSLGVGTRTPHLFLSVGYLPTQCPL